MTFSTLKCSLSYTTEEVDDDDQLLAESRSVLNLTRRVCSVLRLILTRVSV